MANISQHQKEQEEQESTYCPICIEGTLYFGTEVLDECNDLQPDKNNYKKTWKFLFE